EISCYNIKFLPKFKLVYKFVTLITPRKVPSYSPYGTGIREYASGIPELRRLHNSRMVYTKHPVWYIPYDSFAIYQRGYYSIIRKPGIDRGRRGNADGK
ncbi:MAG: hypothetical protein LBV64_01485, partial [Mediterranea sp.]|nr:hypothetical protein [Mediterranea sp.]